jgi:mannan endo-1,4-beta-mannosidase
MSDKQNSSIYAAVDDDTGVLHVIALNKNLDEAVNGTFSIDSTTTYRSASVYAMTQDATSIQSMGQISISGNAFSYTLPPVSAQHFVISDMPASSSSGSSSSSNSSSSSSGGTGSSGGGGGGGSGAWLLLLAGFGLLARVRMSGPLFRRVQALIFYDKGLIKGAFANAKGVETTLI